MPIASISTSYTHEQLSASTTWTITHNLNTSAPSYHCYIDVNGVNTQIIPNEATATDENTLTLTFSTARAGVCRVR